MVRPATFVAYIDESGDEGFRFGAGSSDWLVLSAIVIRKSEEQGVVCLVDDVKTCFSLPSRKPLHCRRLDDVQCAFFIKKIAGAKLVTMSIFMHKPSLIAEKFAEPHRLYFYTVRYLVERISWYCRDHYLTTDSGDGGADLIFSIRHGMPYENMRAYLLKLKRDSEYMPYQIDWSRILIGRVRAEPMSRYKGLQIADGVAHCGFRAVDSSKRAADHRHALALKPVTYHRLGNYTSYGTKFFAPKIAVSKLPFVCAWSRTGVQEISRPRASGSRSVLELPSNGTA